MKYIYQGLPGREVLDIHFEALVADGIRGHRVGPVAPDTTPNANDLVVRDLPSAWGIDPEAQTALLDDEPVYYVQVKLAVGNDNVRPPAAIYGGFVRGPVSLVTRRFPASAVGFENVDKDKLRAKVLDRLTRLRMEDLEAELFRNAAVDIRDANLSRQFRDKHRAGQR
jgi:hypothetical protein